MKKILAILLATCMLLSSFGVFAYDPAEAELKANALNTLGLFKGTDKGYELEKPLTRLEALIMLIRLSGNEMNALYPEEEIKSPFTDAPDWEGAASYMAYGYHNKITSGISETEFAPNMEASLQMYITFVLRALGYVDTEEGSVWERWETLGVQAGILGENTDKATFLRGDAAVISRAALDAKLYNSETTLKEKLIEAGVINAFTLSIAQISEGKAVTPESPLSGILAKMYAGVQDIYPQGLMTMEFKAEDGKYWIAGEETAKEEFVSYLASFIGADAEKIGVTEAIVCEPMMTSNAHSVAVLRVKDGVDVAMAKAEIKNNVDPRKWICVGVNPKNVMVENIGNLIALIMDNNVGNQMSKNFRSMDTTLAVPAENGYLNIDGRYIEAGEAYNKASAQKFAEKFAALKSEHFAENKTYFATIPEQSFYVKDKTVHYLNHNSISADLGDMLYDWTQIEIADALTMDDYYTTDRHWKQENLFDVMNMFGAAMNFTVSPDAYTETVVENYRGDFAKDIADIPAETLKYLVSDVTTGATVADFQDKKATTVYNESKLTSKTPYDVFLSGATPLTVITNPAQTNGRRLIIFRDSFGSSIAPLFIEAYAEVTLVDLRYMSSSLLKQFVKFDNAEVLVLLSDAIVNNSTILK